MWFILLFRMCLLFGFIITALKWGDREKWKKYYPTSLFIMVVNLAANFLMYHHTLWSYNPDAIIKRQTIVEMLNSFAVLPSTAYIYLSHFPFGTRRYKYVYMLLWILLYSVLELVDQILGGISYQNGWSWAMSTLLDCAIFATLLIHYVHPFRAWLITLLIAAVILGMFDFSLADMK